MREMEPSAELLDPSAHYVVWQRDKESSYEDLRASVILSFGGLCLCLVAETSGPGLWWMGQLDPSDGSIACWSPYSDDLAEAIRTL